MHATRFTPYPHLTWLTYGLSIQPPRAFAVHDYRATTHQLIVTEEGDADFSSVVRGITRARHVIRGSLVFCPSGFGRHSLGSTTAGGWRGRVLLMPCDHLPRGGGGHSRHISPGW